MVHQVKHPEILIVDLLQSLIQKLEHVVVGGRESEGFRHLWEDLHLLRLVVDQLRLLLLAAYVAELPAHDRVAQYNRKTRVHQASTATNDPGPSLQHGGV